MTIEIQSLKSAEAKHGEYWFSTLSGNGYELQIHEKIFLKRVPRSELDYIVTSPLRGDYEYIEVIADFNITVGQPAVFILKGLGSLPITIRETTVVLTIYDLQDME